ncbi:MAG: hypothetical protein ACO1N0_03600 [Fluviicola sp.]
MLISPTTFIIFKGAVAIALFAICFYLIKDRLESKKKTVLSILVGVVGFVAVQMVFSKIYIIDSYLTYEEFYLIGSTNQALGNGKTIQISPSKFDKVTIVNRSDFKLILEEIIYTDNANSVYSEGDYEIPAHTSLEVGLPESQITYFFDQNIPDAVEVQGGSSKKQYWLRLESQADNDDSADEYQ